MNKQERNAEIIRQYKLGKKQIDIAADMGLSKSVINTVVMAYKESQNNGFSNLLKYNDRLRVIARMLAPNDTVIVYRNGEMKEATVISTYQHTFLCQNEHGIKLSPKYEEIEVWNGVYVRGKEC